MGYAVGWDEEYGRFRGYGVPAWCDGMCGTKIDRGMGWEVEGYDELDEDGEPIGEPDGMRLYLCSNCDVNDLDEDGHLPPEHPEWLEHVLTDDSWATWRDENPVRVDMYKESLEAQRILGQLTPVTPVEEDE